MKNTILFLLVQLTLCWQFVLSQTTEFPMKESSLLWKIEGPGIPKGSYLFGTMHMIEKEYFIFPDKLEKIVKKSEQLVMELAGLPNQKDAMKYVLLEEGTFFDYFSKEQTDSILIWAKKEFKMDEAAFRATMSKMKPFVVVQMATQIHFMGKTESYEMTLEEIAKTNQLSIAGLETIEQQMAFFDDLTKEQQAEMVMEGIRDSEKSIETMKEMEVLYQGQNVDSLYLMIQDEGGVISAESADFLDNRNAAWVPQIKEMIASKRCFIAVGAGHLGGPNGVIRLLEKEGYTLTPIEL
jgi:uncharacterized protein YbaP (TraB family)